MKTEISGGHRAERYRSFHWRSAPLDGRLIAKLEGYPGPLLSTTSPISMRRMAPDMASAERFFY